VVYAPAGNCVFYVIYPIVPIIFATLDAFLAMGMLIIFLIPLWAHSKGMLETKGTVKSQISNVIRRNIIFSSIALTSGFVGLVTLSILEWVANEDPSGNSDDLRIWASFTIAFDNFIGVAAIHGMTTGWLPRIVQRRFRLVPGSSAISTTNNRKVVSSDNRVASSDQEERTHMSNSIVQAANPKFDMESETN